MAKGWWQVPSPAGLSNNPILPDIGLSPAQLLMGRRLTNELPMMENLLTPTSNHQDEISKHLKETKEDQKRYHDRHASKRMKELKQCTKVRMQPDTDSKPWRAAIVVRHHHSPRSYVVQEEEGRNYRLNRQHLRVCPVPEQEIDPEPWLEDRANLAVAKDKSGQDAPPAVLPDPTSQEQHFQLLKESGGTPNVTREADSPTDFSVYYYYYYYYNMMNDIGIDKKQQRYIIKKLINIAIRATYYIFCRRNRNWDSPDLMQFWKFFCFFGFCFVLFLFCCCCFFFLILQSQAAFVNCLYVARFTIVHSKTQIKFQLLLLLLLLLLLSLLRNSNLFLQVLLFFVYYYYYYYYYYCFTFLKRGCDIKCIAR